MFRFSFFTSGNRWPGALAGLVALLSGIMCSNVLATEEHVAGEETAIIQSLSMLTMTNLSSQQCHSQSLDISDWSQVTFSSIQPQQHICIRASLNITEHNLQDNPALLLVALAAYEVHLNGEFLGRNGVVGTSAETEQVGAFSSLFSLDSNLLKPGQHLLSIELSSFLADPSFAGIAYLLMVADQQSLSDTILMVSLITALLIGGLLMLFTIFQVLYWHYSRERTFLVFSVLCFCTGALLVAEQWKLWVNYHYDWHLFRLKTIVAITMAITALLPAYYLLQHKTTKIHYWLTMLMVCQLATLMLAQSYDARSEWLFIVSLLFALTINLFAFRQRKPFAKTALVIVSISLLSLLVAPLLFLELGFGLAVCLILASIGLSLLGQLRIQRDTALQTGRIKGELLRRHLQPHYLMNCLMQVQELIDVAPSQANTFVAELADEFRDLVKMSAQDFVTLNEELALCQKHLAIMSIRYQQKYQLEVNIAGQDKAAKEKKQSILVPSAVVHSQIENCFSHNRISGKDFLSLDVSISGDTAILVLKTPVSTAIDHQGLGIGEAYIRAKMAEVCAAGWQLHSFEENGFWVTRYQYRVSDVKEINPG